LGSGLDEGWLDWVVKAAELEVAAEVGELLVVVVVWCSGAWVVESDEAIVVFCWDAELDDEVGSSLLLLSSAAMPRFCSASSFVARVHALGLGRAGGGRRSTRSLPEFSTETSALSTICSEI
jgi:hypothetical protein